MNNIGVIGFTMAMSALSISILGIIYVHGRINNLEKKLKEFDVIPKEFESVSKEFNPLKKELDKFSKSGG